MQSHRVLWIDILYTGSEFMHSKGFSSSEHWSKLSSNHSMSTILSHASSSQANYKHWKSETETTISNRGCDCYAYEGTALVVLARYQANLWALKDSQRDWTAVNGHA
jgi:hypothetical protein